MNSLSLEAALAAGGALQIGPVEAQLEKFCARLKKFDRDHLLQIVGGLLTEPQFHANTTRLEMLAHLCALRCRGGQRPNTAQVREWLNQQLRALKHIEDPPEDVFIGNVISGLGNSRLFEGIWEANAAHLQSCLYAIHHCAAAGEHWAEHCARQASALLQLSDAVAERGKLPRYTTGGGRPRGELSLTTTSIADSSARVRFDVAELGALGIAPFDLLPFGFPDAKTEALRGEAIIWSSLERHPLLIDSQGVTLALPTAVGAAIRRRAMEMAADNGAAELFDGYVREHQLRALQKAMFRLGLSALRPPVTSNGGRITHFECQFDEGGFAHVLLVGDSTEEILASGFQSLADVGPGLPETVAETAYRLAERDNFQLGLTLVVFGGLGRGMPVGAAKLPPNWQFTGLGYEDLELWSADHDTSALRMVRLLRQAEDLEAAGVMMINANGFLNLYGYAEHSEFELLPAGATPGATMLHLATDHLASVRVRLRERLDPHGAVLPGNRQVAEVQRSSTRSFFPELNTEPLYISIDHMLSGELAAVIDRPARSWWVMVDSNAPRRRGSLPYRMWDLTNNWLARIVPDLEARLSGLPAGALKIRLDFPGLADIDERSLTGEGPVAPPSTTRADGEIRIGCAEPFLRAFAKPTNIGDRWMVEALAMGAALLAGESHPDVFAADVGDRAVKGDRARYLHIMEPSSAAMATLMALDLPGPRLAQPEVRGWLEIGLAQAAGASAEASGLLHGKAASELLNKSVEALWERVRNRLTGLDRRSVVQRCLANHNAVERDRLTWRNTAAALLHLHDSVTVLNKAVALESERADAGLCSRVVAEMALSTCPAAGGRDCSLDDLDELIAGVSLLVHLAYRNDEIFHGFADRIEVMPNGSLRFEEAFTEKIQRPFMITEGQSQYRAAAEAYVDLYAKPEELSDEEYIRNADAEFDAAFVEEYGVTPLGLADFLTELSVRALEAGQHVLAIDRSELLAMAAALPDVTTDHAAKLIDAWSLAPRRRWDEDRPEGATKRDWYPWRYARRLSLLARPIVQLRDGPDALCIISPALAEQSLHYALRSYSARLPEAFFRTKAMRRWIGKVIDERGHAFNLRVAERLSELGFEVRPECLMTQLGGTKQDGDVDVLAWHRAAGTVFVIECKRLLADRTPGEIAERLREYDPQAGAGSSKRGPTRKHLDRMAILTGKPAALTAITGVPLDRITVKSCLVTARLVPMQFEAAASAHFEIIAAFDELESAFTVR